MMENIDRVNDLENWEIVSKFMGKERDAMSLLSDNHTYTLGGEEYTIRELKEAIMSCWVISIDNPLSDLVTHIQQYYSLTPEKSNDLLSELTQVMEKYTRII
ncbi:MAG: hypothetical protein ACLFVI_03265 [Archaeoglobaceae archaeon]